MNLVPILLFALALEPGGAAPADPAAAPTEHRLSPAEVEEVLEQAARRRNGEAAPADAPAEQSRSRSLPVHGEVGFTIGTGGYRAGHGTAIIDLPGKGRAILSVGSSRLPGDYFYYPYR